MTYGVRFEVLRYRKIPKADRFFAHFATENESRTNKEQARTCRILHTVVINRRKNLNGGAEQFLFCCTGASKFIFDVLTVLTGTAFVDVSRCTFHHNDPKKQDTNQESPSCPHHSSQLTSLLKRQLSPLSRTVHTHDHFYQYDDRA